MRSPSPTAVMSRLRAVLAGVASAVACLAAAPPSPPVPVRAESATGSWTQYHGDASHTGYDGAVAGFDSVALPGTQLLQGSSNDLIFASPVVHAGVAYIASELNNVFARKVADGSQLWTKQVATPASFSDPGAIHSGCSFPGNYSGITSTPVIDPAANRLYLVAYVDTGPTNRRYQYRAFALDLASGDILWQTEVDPGGGFDPTAQNQRGALALANGRIYIPFGGRLGECGTYHGYIASIATDGGNVTTVQETSVPGGGSWAGSGLAVDSRGNVYSTTGNSQGSGTYGNQESVLKYGPTLTQLRNWAPADWLSLDASGTDLGSSGPLLIGQRWVFTAGKNGTGYVISQEYLGCGPGTPNGTQCSPGGEVSRLDFGGGECWGHAYDGQRIYVGCANGLYALNLDPVTGALSRAWGPVGGPADPPIVVGGIVFWLDRTRSLNAVHGADGTPVQGTSPVINSQGHNNFTSLAATDRQVLAPFETGVWSFTLVNPRAPASTYSPVTYNPVSPTRLMDTRPGSAVGPRTTPLGPGESYWLDLPYMASAVTLNVTVTNTTAASFLTLFPGPVPPTASNLNWSPGQTVANLVQIPSTQSGPESYIGIYNYAGSADVVIDLEGWFSASGPASYRPAAVPYRVLDTRPSSQAGPYSTPFGGDQTRLVPIPSAPANAVAVVLNATVTNTAQPGYLTLYAAGSGSRPTASNLNWATGQTVPNRAVVPLGAQSTIAVYNYQGPTDVILDVNGFYVTDGSGFAFHPVNPLRVMDTRASSQAGPYRTPFGPGTLRSLQIAVPGQPSGLLAQAMVMNVTVTNPDSAGFLTVFPSSPGPAPPPTASDQNWTPGVTRANLVVTSAGTGPAGSGSVSFYNYTGNVDVIADLTGWYG